MVEQGLASQPAAVPPEAQACSNLAGRSKQPRPQPRAMTTTVGEALSGRSQVLLPHLPGSFFSLCPAALGTDLGGYSPDVLKKVRRRHR